MKKVRVGLLTIGQSPRDDLVPEIKPLLHPHIEIMEYGLLDNLNTGEVSLLKPEEGETPLVTRMRDGRQVQLSEQKINQLMPEAIKSMISNLHVEAVGILCTHDFPKMKFSCPTLFPFDIIQFLINQILKVKTLGIVVPLRNQIEMTKKKWRKANTYVQVKSPYTEGKTWEEIAKNFTKQKVEAIVLDCIGYRMKDSQEIQNLISVPTLLPRTILAHTINQLF